MADGAATGGVWLFEQPAPVPFDLAEIESMLGKFISDKLPALLNRKTHREKHGVQDWELRSSCLACSFVSDCRAEAKREGKLEAIAGLGRRRRLEIEAVVPPAAADAPPGQTPLQRLELAVARPQPEESVRRLFSRSLLVQYDEQHAPIALAPTILHPTEPPPPVAYSPLIGALLSPTGTCQLNGRASLTLPEVDDLAVHLVVLEDPLVRSFLRHTRRLI